MDERIRTIGYRIRRWLEDQYSSAVKAVVLYGSHARGTATEESDIDLLVIIDNAMDPWEVRNSLDDLLLDILLENDLLVSVVVVPEDYYERYTTPFLINVRRDGVVL